MVEKNDVKNIDFDDSLWWISDDLNSLKNEVDLQNTEKSEEKNDSENVSESLNNLGNSLINSKLDELQSKVEDTLLDSSLENNFMWESNDNITKWQIDEFFEKWKEEFNDDKKTIVENKFVKKYQNLEDRNMDVAKWIESSADKISDEIKNWKEEKNPVARSLLRFVNWIMKSEK